MLKFLLVINMTGFKASQSTHNTAISSFGSEMSRISYARLHSCNEVLSLLGTLTPNWNNLKFQSPFKFCASCPKFHKSKFQLFQKNTKSNTFNSPKSLLPSLSFQDLLPGLSPYDRLPYDCPVWLIPYDCLPSNRLSSMVNPIRLSSLNFS